MAERLVDTWRQIDRHKEKRGDMHADGQEDRTVYRQVDKERSRQEVRKTDKEVDI